MAILLFYVNSLNNLGYYLSPTKFKPTKLSVEQPAANLKSIPTVIQHGGQLPLPESSPITRTKLGTVKLSNYASQLLKPI